MRTINYRTAVLGAFLTLFFTGCGTTGLSDSQQLTDLGKAALPDSDHDGIPDIFDADPYNPDANGNGIIDGVDPAVNVGLQQALGGGQTPDVSNDRDHDGTPDDLDPFPDDPDHNTNGIPDGLEQDYDGDGIPDAIDPYPTDPDHNHNGIKDGWESDYDGDGIKDAFDAHPTDKDFNKNGILDGLEQDTDGDGIPDANDPDPLNPDANGNGIADGNDHLYGQQHHLGPGGEAPDEDMDGLPVGLDPDDHNPDFDGDGAPDGVDEFPTDPTRQ